MSPPVICVISYNKMLKRINSHHSTMAAFVDGDVTHAAKKQKLSDEGETGKLPHNIFKNFKLDRVLREDPKNKLITFVGQFADDTENRDAVVLLERLPFVKEHVADTLTSEDGRTKETLKNDIYSTLSVSTPRTIPDCKATLIYPATSKHIAKYSDHAGFIIRETPHLYRTVTQPCLEANKFSVQWVHNILEKKTEADRIVFEDTDPDTGFILLPDMKWNRTDLSSLYLVAIVHKHGIGSLRDLTAQHLPLLRNILEKGKAAIKEHFNIPPDQLRIYLHYQPSYNHLHVHFTHLNFDAPGSDCLRAHLLEDIIDNLEMDDDFYSKKTLVYVGIGVGYEASAGNFTLFRGANQQMWCGAYGLPAPKHHPELLKLLRNRTFMANFVCMEINSKVACQPYGFLPNGSLHCSVNKLHVHYKY